MVCEASDFPQSRCENEVTIEFEHFQNGAQQQHLKTFWSHKEKASCTVFLHKLPQICFIHGWYV